MEVNQAATKLSWDTEVIFYMRQVYSMCVWWILERANQSIQQLSSTLEQQSPNGEDFEELRVTDGSLFTNVAEEDKAAWSQKTQSEAGDLLTTFWKTLQYALPGDFPTCNLVERHYTSYYRMFCVCVCVCVCVHVVLVSFDIVVNQLKSLLLKQCREIPSALSSSKKQSPSKVDCSYVHI